METPIYKENTNERNYYLQCNESFLSNPIDSSIDLYSDGELYIDETECSSITKSSIIINLITKDSQLLNECSTTNIQIQCPNGKNLDIILKNLLLDDQNNVLNDGENSV